MKFSLDRKSFENVLKMVSKFAPSKTTLPILTSMYIEVTDSEVILACSSIERTITTRIQTIAPETGKVCVDARRITEIVSSFDGSDVSVQLEGNSLNIKSGKHRSSLSTIDAIDFPALFKTPENTKELPMKGWHSVVNMVSFAVSYDEARPVLMCVNFAKGKASATDGFRVACLPFEAFDQSVNIPIESFSSIANTFGSEEVVKWVFDNGKLYFDNNTTQLVLNCRDGNYPDINQIVPKSTATVVTANVTELKNACKVVNVIAREGTSIVALDCRDGAIDLSANTASIGDANAKVDCTIEGEPIKISVNIKFLQQGLNATVTNDILLKCNKPNTPMIVQDKNFPDWLYVIMPMYGTQG